MIRIIIIPIGLIVRLVTCCINACGNEVAERRARRERLIAKRERARTVHVVRDAPTAPARPPPYSARPHQDHVSTESSPLLYK